METVTVSFPTWPIWFIVAVVCFFIGKKIMDAGSGSSNLGPSVDPFAMVLAGIFGLAGVFAAFWGIFVLLG